jgi:hypothetical protein
MKAGMSVEPVSDRGMLMGSVIVTDQVQHPLGVTSGQRVQKSDELQVRMALEATPANFAAGR